MNFLQSRKVLVTGHHRHMKSYANTFREVCKCFKTEL